MRPYAYIQVGSWIFNNDVKFIYCSIREFFDEYMSTKKEKYIKDINVFDILVQTLIVIIKSISFEMVDSVSRQRLVNGTEYLLCIILKSDLVYIQDKFAFLDILDLVLQQL